MGGTCPTRIYGKSMEAVMKGDYANCLTDNDFLFAPISTIFAIEYNFPCLVCAIIFARDTANL